VVSSVSRGLLHHWFHHSVNYRSAVLFGQARLVEEEEIKREAMRALVDHVMPGRSGHARSLSPQELAATQVLSLPLTEASAKIRTGPPLDEADDLMFDVWAGVLPLQVVPGPPVPDARLLAGSGVSEHVAVWSGPR
jgi:hypothetical protein